MPAKKLKNITSKKKINSSIYLKKSQKNLILKNTKTNLKKRIPKSANKQFILKKEDTESDRSYQLRELFWKLNKPKNEEESKKIYVLSWVLSNKVFLKVRYSTDIEHDLNKRLIKNPINLGLFHSKQHS